MPEAEAARAEAEVEAAAEESESAASKDQSIMICRFPDPVDGKMRYLLTEVGEMGQRVGGGGAATAAEPFLMPNKQNRPTPSQVLSEHFPGVELAHDIRSLHLCQR